MFEPIKLSPEEYWGLAWALCMVGLFFTMRFMLELPNEKDEDDEF